MLLFVIFVYVLIIADGFLAFQVLFPSGARVTIFRRGHGLDVNVYTPRAKNIANEMGLCVFDGRENENTYGNNLR